MLQGARRARHPPRPGHRHAHRRHQRRDGRRGPDARPRSTSSPRSGPGSRTPTCSAASAYSRLQTLARTRTAVHEQRSRSGALLHAAPRRETASRTCRCRSSASPPASSRRRRATSTPAPWSPAVHGVLGRARPVPAGARSTGEHFLDGGHRRLDPARPCGRAGRAPRCTSSRWVASSSRSRHRPSRGRWRSSPFEIARRHRFAGDLDALPAHVTAHVLPTGGEQPRYNDPVAAALPRPQPGAAAASTGPTRPPPPTWTSTGWAAREPPVPPRIVRRLLMAPLVMLTAFWVADRRCPILVILAAVVSPFLPGKWRPCGCSRSPCSTWRWSSSACSPPSACGWRAASAGDPLAAVRGAALRAAAVGAAGPVLGAERLLHPGVSRSRPARSPPSPAGRRSSSCRGTPGPATRSCSRTRS